MVTVKKFSLQDAHAQMHQENGRTYHAPPGFAVVDDSGNIVTGKNAVGPYFEVYEFKGTAQRQADWLNRNDREVK